MARKSGRNRSTRQLAKARIRRTALRSPRFHKLAMKAHRARRRAQAYRYAMALPRANIAVRSRISTVKNPLRRVVRSQSKFVRNKALLKSALRGNVFSVRALVKKICKARRQRKEVMHAKKKAGRGGQRRPNWKPESRVRC